MEARRRVHVIASGRVQGVFYRATCIERARALGLGGWVRNLVDGRVEAAFEGPPDDVEAIVAWCRQGPPRATVTALVLEEESPLGEESFRVTG
ncbi:MAG: acylphosphatase [Actinomycetota bacterium]